MAQYRVTVLKRITRPRHGGGGKETVVNQSALDIPTGKPFNPKEGEVDAYRVTPGHSVTVSARQVLGIRDSALFKMGAVKIDPVEEQSAEIEQIIALAAKEKDTKALRKRLQGIDNDGLLDELLVAALEQKLPDSVREAIENRRDAIRVVSIAE